MNLKFYKYQGTGNDFILIDNRERQYDDIDVKSLCYRQFGIGADGLMLLQETDGYDFEMVYYNSDGHISTMCGNGGRCIVAFAGFLGILKSERVQFLAIDGPHDAIYLPEWKDGKEKNTVELQLKNVKEVLKTNNDFVLDTGSPHYVQFVENVNDLDIIKAAHAIRYSETFKEKGINVNFVEILSLNHIKVRTYERGVENETLSCGTGVTASSIAYLSKLNNFETGLYTINIETPGGQLQVQFFYSNFDLEFQNVTLIGPAERVFEGEIKLD